ncbi:hypothetical protein C8J56DRAFT_940091 [Mycena floridula]|nr:hypothetical protein C8J56DRAFT_945984 [Mycena floridula]KAJ7588813.1 hypothetical protein C8J56DRAFT_940091 [Mycena floridula]
MLVRNQSPFDATIQVAEDSPNGCVYVLSPDLLAGHSWLYCLDKEDIPSGTELQAQVIYELHTGRAKSILTFSTATSQKVQYLVQGIKDKPEIVYAGPCDAGELPFSFPTDQELRDYSKSVADKVIPAPPKSLTEKSRWLLCVVKNKTQFRIVLQDQHTYFDSGRYWQPPSDILPFDQMIFTCCEGDNTWFTGATGGTAFRLMLDRVTSYNIAVGWTNPYAGSIKAGIVNSNDPKAGYNCASPEGNELKSELKLKGLDNDGKSGAWTLNMSAAAGNTIIYTISEIRVA